MLTRQQLEVCGVLYMVDGGTEMLLLLFGGWLRRAETAGGESQLKMEKLFWTSWGGGEVRIAVLLVGTLKEVKLNPGNTV